MFDFMCAAVLGDGQPYSQLLCVTARAQGIARVSTSAGSASALYSSAELLQPPIVRTIAPLVWDPSLPTTIVIEGERCGRRLSGRRWCMWESSVCLLRGALFPRVRRGAQAHG